MHLSNLIARCIGTLLCLLILAMTISMIVQLQIDHPFDITSITAACFRIFRRNERTTAESSIANVLLSLQAPLTFEKCNNVSKIYQEVASMRYAALRADAADPTPYNLHHRYFVALNLHQNEAILPDMITNLVHLAAFLGADNMFISIFENGSLDRSKALLNLARSVFKVAGVEHSIISSNRRRTKWEHRVAFLADVRNQALEPLHTLRREHGITFDTVVFMNDVLYCLDDVLELIWQSRLSEATITCPMDFDSALDDPAVYDIWVGHDISGDVFKKRPREAVISHGPDRDRWLRNSPFQAFCCWGGMAILDPEPLYHPHNIGFRMADIDNGECSASECSLLCKDYWTAGYGRVLVVPRVRVSYTKQVFDGLHLLHPEVDNDLHNAYISPHDLLFSKEESEPFIFRPGPERVLCRGWQEAGFISMPDRPPVWERRPREIKNAIEVWHHRGFGDDAL